MKNLRSSGALGRAIPGVEDETTPAISLLLSTLASPAAIVASAWSRWPRILH